MKDKNGACKHQLNYEQTSKNIWNINCIHCKQEWLGIGV